MAHTFTLQSGTAVVIDDLVKAARDALADGEVTFGEVVQLGGLLAGKVNQFAGLSGPEKQKVVIAAVEKALELTLAEKLKTLPEADREAFEKKVQTAVGFAKETLPAVLNLAVDAANGKLDLGHVKKTCLQTLILTLRCVAKQAPQLPMVAAAASAVESLAAKELKDEQAAPAEKPQPSKAPEESQAAAPVETQQEPQKE
jgi:hypothetical protein